MILVVGATGRLGRLIAQTLLGHGKQVRILVRRGDMWREVARCQGTCRDILVWRRRVAYLDGAQLIERRPRHVTKWHVPAGVTLHRAVNALFGH